VGPRPSRLHDPHVMEDCASGNAHRIGTSRRWHTLARTEGCDIDGRDGGRTSTGHVDRSHGNAVRRITSESHGRVARLGGADRDRRGRCAVRIVDDVRQNRAKAARERTRDVSASVPANA
jgi:hypothetical protein